MGLLSPSNLAICIKKAEFAGFKASKVISKVTLYPKFNFGQLNAYKRNFAIELSIEKGMINFSGCWIFCFCTP